MCVCTGYFDTFFTFWLNTVLVERLKGSFEWSDLGLNLIDSEFYAQFQGAFFKFQLSIF